MVKSLKFHHGDILLDGDRAGRVVVSTPTFVVLEFEDDERDVYLSCDWKQLKKK